MRPLLAWAGGLAAAAAAGLGMLVIRQTLQVRSIPERLLEWLLLFVPPDTFESALQRFGFNAKRYGLYLGIVIVLGLLAWLGRVALRRHWPPPALLLLGVGLWLFTMLIIMPLTSAGVFAIGLFEGRSATVLGYLAVSLLYAATLALVDVLVVEPMLPTESRWHPPAGVPLAPQLTSRRWALSLLGSAVVVFGAGLILNVVWPRRQRLPNIAVADPQEPVPSGGLDEPNAHPNVVPSAVAAPPRATPAPTSTGLPEPAPARQLARDQDGAVLPSGRRPGELPDLVTSNENFYIVTKNAGGDPVLHPDDWRLVVDGEVQRPFELDYATLRKLPAVEVTKTLECISNLVDKCELAPFGCDLISTARWKGVRLTDILNLVGGVKPGAAVLATISADEYTTALPMSVALSPDTLLVYEMNGQVLPREHGYPARLLVPDRYGMKNAKWVVALRPMRREFVDWYGQRNWSKEAIVRTMSRIDVPARDAHVSPGEQRIAGIAYAGARGVSKVEFSADGGATWRTAELLEPPAARDVWVRWQGRFTMPARGDLTLQARATDGTGALQEHDFSLPQPDGAAGWNTVTVHAA